MKKIKLSELKDFCEKAAVAAGMGQEDARVTAEVLAGTDAFGTHSHGTKNLLGYINKAEAGGVSLTAQPEIIKEGPAYALIDANNCIGMVSSYKAMELAIEKARECGIALVTVKNGTHFGAAGFYSNMAAAKGMLGIAMSNVDPNMTIPGARGMILGNNPLSYASPLESAPSCFLDIAMSNVASLKVVQARKDGKSIPDTWIVDKNGLPTTDPSHYPEEGAMQPMAAHKGYGIAVLVELLTGVLSGGKIGSLGEIPSWCFVPEKPNGVSNTFIVIDVDKFAGRDSYIARSEAFMDALHNTDKAQNVERIFVPGEMEWNRYEKAAEALELPDAVADSLCELSDKCGISIPWMD